MVVKITILDMFFSPYKFLYNTFNGGIKTLKSMRKYAVHLLRPRFFILYLF